MFRQLGLVRYTVLLEHAHAQAHTPNPTPRRLLGPGGRYALFIGFNRDNEHNQKTTHAASSTPPNTWAARCVVHWYSADSLVALSRSDEDVMTMTVYLKMFGLWLIHVK